MIKAVIFDLDGTLHPRDGELYRSMSSNVRMWFKRNMDTQDFETTFERMKTQYPNVFHAIESLGLDPLLYQLEVFGNLRVKEYLSKDEKMRRVLETLPCPKFIVTQSSVSHCICVLDALGVSNLFKECFCFGLEWNTFDKTNAYETIRRHESLQASEILIVGDSYETDLERAITLGYECILISDVCCEKIRTIRKIEEIAYFDFQTQPKVKKGKD